MTPLSVKTRFTSRTLAAWLVLALTFFIITPGLGGAAAVGNLVYAWQRQLRQRELLAPFRDLSELRSDHFVLRYDGDLDSAWAPVVLDSAEAARKAVLRGLGWSSLAAAGAGAAADPEAGGAPADGGRVTLLLYPDYASLSQQFGSRSGFRALGAYWGGVIQVLTPRLWLAGEPGPDAARQLWTRGPLVHEYTHLLLDRLVPGGNYPRWLSEGLAQFVEYRETGYLWLEPESLIRPPVSTATFYSLSDLQRGFDGLENTALAYREAFLLVAYLEDAYGAGRLNLLLKGLAGGETFYRALRDTTGLGAADFESGWRLWLDQNLARYSVSTGEEGTRG